MNKKVLLIADDDEMNRRIIRRFLKDSFEIIEARDGEEALETLHSTHVDALLLDIIMPKMDGLEVLSQMREESKFNQVGILVATSTKEKTERSALALGADDIVSKPYDPIVIQKRLENIMAMKEIHAQKELLQNNDIDALLELKMDAFLSRATVISERICKYADILNANKENKKLVAEITEDIKKEAGNIVEIFKEK